MEDQLSQFTFRDFVDLAISVLTFITLAVGLFYIFKKWILGLNQQVKTQNGMTVGQYAEQIFHKVVDLEKANDKLWKKVDANSELAKESMLTATKALGVAESVSGRLDAYFLGKSQQEQRDAE